MVLGNIRVMHIFLGRLGFPEHFESRTRQRNVIRSWFLRWKADELFLEATVDQLLEML